MANETIDTLPLPQQRAYWEKIHDHQEGNTPEYREAVMRIAAIDAALAVQPSSLSAAVETLEKLIAKWRAFVARTREVEVRLPSGVMEETRARMRGLADQGEADANELESALQQLQGVPETPETGSR